MKKSLNNKLGIESGTWTSNVLWILAGKCVSMFFFLAFDIFIARFLNVTGYSEWAYFFSILSILYCLGWFGINSSARVIVSKQADKVRRTECLYSAVVVRITFSIIICFILYLFSGKLAAVVNVDDKYTDLEILIKIGVGVILFNSFMEFYKEIFQGIQKYRNIFLISVFEYGGYFLFTVVALLVTGEVYGIAWAYLFAGILTTVIGGRLLYAEYKGSRNNNYSKAVAYGYSIEIIKYAFPLILSSVGSIAIVEMDIFMLGYMSNSHEIAIYNVAKQICNKIMHLNYSLCAGTLATISIITVDNYKKQQASFHKIRRINHILIIIASISLIVIGRWFVPMVYGEEFEDAGSIIYVLIIYYILNGVSTLNSGFLDYQKKAGVRSIWFLSVPTINFILNILFIPRIGAFGAAIATVMSLIPYAIYLYLAANNVFKRLEKQYYSKQPVTKNM